MRVRIDTWSNAGVRSVAAHVGCLNAREPPVVQSNSIKGDSGPNICETLWNGDAFIRVRPPSPANSFCIVISVLWYLSPFKCTASLVAAQALRAHLQRSVSRWYALGACLRFPQRSLRLRRYGSLDAQPISDATLDYSSGMDLTENTTKVYFVTRVDLLMGASRGLHADNWCLMGRGSIQGIACIVQCLIRLEENKNLRDVRYDSIYFLLDIFLCTISCNSVYALK